MFYSYTSNYENPLLRGTENPRPWDLKEMILSHAGSEKTLLDIGCGTAMKLIPIASFFNYIIGVDPNSVMLKQAQENIDRNSIKNIRLLEGFAHRLPTDNAQFDMATCMGAVHEVQELYRTLKPGGITIIETHGERDKFDLKKYFLDQHNQPRGQLSYLPPNSIKQLNEKMFQCLFSKVTMSEGFWDAFLTWDELVLLLTNTPTIKNFNLDSDKATLKEAIKNLETDQGIYKITHHRILIMATK